MESIVVNAKDSCVAENGVTVKCVRREIIAFRVPDTAHAAFYTRTTHFSQYNLHYHLVPAI